MRATDPRAVRRLGMAVLAGSALMASPVRGQESVSVSLAAALRLRVEGWSNFGFDPDQDDTFLLSRILFGTDLRLGDHFRVYVQARSSLSTPRDLPGGRRSIDADDLGLQNAFLDVVLPLGEDYRLTARGGRQEMSFGKQRLVSPLDWANTQRTFDGARAILEAKGVTAQGYWARKVNVRKSDFNVSDDESDFFGVYVTDSLVAGSLGLDVYWLALVRDSAAFNGTSGKENRQTIGARVGGALAGARLHYDVEAAFQFGALAGKDISAFMVGSQATYAFTRAPVRPRVLVGFDYGSGDANPGGEVGTFNQLFPLGHAFLGYADVVGRQNVISPSIGVGLEPVRGLNIAIRGYRFWRASLHDALYNAGGAVVRAPGDGESRSVGSELDFTTAYRFGGHLTALVGYSRFFAGRFVEETGPSDDTGFLYASLTARLSN